MLHFLLKHSTSQHRKRDGKKKKMRRISREIAIQSRKKQKVIAQRLCVF